MSRPGISVGLAVLMIGCSGNGTSAASSEGREAEILQVEQFRTQLHCPDCHTEISREWEQSGHAGVERWQRLSRELGAEAVAHLEAYYRPAALLARDDPSQPPSRRSVFPERGVDCISCHMDAQFRMHGPQAYEAPHNTFADERLDTVEACRPCHGQGDELDTVTAWKESGFEQAMLSCRSCHMLDTYRRLAQHASLAELPQRSSHRHGFRGPLEAVFVDSAILLELQVSSGQIQVELTAQGIGHRFPGLGFRQVVVRTQGLDASGQVLWQRDEIIEESRQNRLRPNETRKFSYPAQEAAEVESRLLYKWTSKTPESEAIVLKRVGIEGISRQDAKAQG